MLQQRQNKTHNAILKDKNFRNFSKTIILLKERKTLTRILKEHFQKPYVPYSNATPNENNINNIKELHLG